MVRPPMALRRRYSLAWSAYARIRAYSKFQARWRMSSHSAVYCWSNPTQRSLCPVIGIGRYLNHSVSNPNPREISLRTHGSLRSRLSLGANGSPWTGITPASTGLLGRLRSKPKRHPKQENCPRPSKVLHLRELHRRKSFQLQRYRYESFYSLRY
jgi:hypothetical protein